MASLKANDKPSASVIALGPPNQGKTTLASALVAACAQRPFSQLSLSSMESCQYQTESRRYLHTELGYQLADARRFLKVPDGALLILSPERTSLEQAERYVKLLAEWGSLPLIVFFNKAEQAPSPAALDEAELTIRELLCSYGCLGDEAPVIRGSALCFKEKRLPALGEAAILGLLEALDSYVPQRLPLDARPLLLPIRGIFYSNRLRSVALVGQLERGSLRAGQEVALVGRGPSCMVRVERVEGEHRSGGPYAAGEEVTFTLTSPVAFEGRCGQVLAAPGTISDYSSFEARLSLLPSSRVTLSSADSVGLSFWRALTVAGRIQLLGAEALRPGGSQIAQIKLRETVALEIGQRFLLMEGGRAIGFGVVSTF